MFKSLTTATAILALGFAPIVPDGLAQAPSREPEQGPCAPCHTCPDPTPENPCLHSCARDVESPSCGLPEVLVLDDLENLYEPVRFDHRGHAEMAEMTASCDVCHHQTPEGEPRPACRTCHDTAIAREDIKMPGLRGAYHRQCMSCHREWSHESACGACHQPKPRGVTLTATLASSELVARPAHLIKAETTYVYHTDEQPWPVVTFHHIDHVDSFGLQCGDCHRGDSCGRCHDDTSDTVEHPGVSSRETCSSCHAERSCGFCHDEEVRPSFDHAAVTGWSLEPQHAEVTCVACHGSTGTFTSPSPVCHSCHFHRQNGDLAHGNLELASNQGTEGLDCLSCHDELKARFDRATVVHGAVAGGDGCASCHGPLVSSSPRLPPEPRKELCLGCHNRPIDCGGDRPLANIAALLAGSPNHHGPIRAGDCCACHQPHASEHTRLLIDEYPSEFYASFESDRYRLCFRCHEEERVLARSGTGLTGFRDGDLNLHWLHVNRKKGRTCRTCHEVHASDRPFHIRDSVPFGDARWMLPIGYAQTADGGGCAPACHEAQTYDRDEGIALRSAPGEGGRSTAVRPAG